MEKTISEAKVKKVVRAAFTVLEHEIENKKLTKKKRAEIFESLEFCIILELFGSVSPTKLGE